MSTTKTPASAAEITKTLSPMERDGYISSFRVDDDGKKVMISLRLGYRNPSDPSEGYDDRGADKMVNINAFMSGFGLKYSDGGFEDDGSGREFWIFRA
jgi:hypothetical protein